MDGVQNKPTLCICSVAPWDIWCGSGMQVTRQRGAAKLPSCAQLSPPPLKGEITNQETDVCLATAENLLYTN